MKLASSEFSSWVLRIVFPASDKVEDVLDWGTLETAENLTTKEHLQKKVDFSSYPVHAISRKKFIIIPSAYALFR